MKNKFHLLALLALCLPGAAFAQAPSQDTAGALCAINTGVVFHDRVFSTTAVTTIPCDLPIGMPAGTMARHAAVSIFSNRFATWFTVQLEDGMVGSYDLVLYNALGAPVVNTCLTRSLTHLMTDALPKGHYTYQLTGTDGSAHTGKLMAGE